MGNSNGISVSVGLYRRCRDFFFFELLPTLPRHLFACARSASGGYLLSHHAALAYRERNTLGLLVRG